MPPQPEFFPYVMTIAIALKVGDGVVLGTDSASTLAAGSVYYNSYFTGEKMLNVVCGLPVGLATYGLGGLGGRSTIRLARDLRNELTHQASQRYINPESYSVEQIAGHVRDFFYEDRYKAEAAASPQPISPMGFIIAGYSARSTAPEVWEVMMDASGCGAPQCSSPATDSDGLLWQGQGEPLTRLIAGHTHALIERLTAEGVDPALLDQHKNVVAPLWHSAMPVQDAIDLVQYLADVVCGFTRFSPGNLTVAPPIDLAAITVHEGFRWVSRKHYYPSQLNPPDKYTSPHYHPQSGD